MRRALVVLLCLCFSVGLSGAGLPGSDGAGSGHAAAAQDQRPNVLLIVTDDQRDSGTLGVMPKLRRLVFGQGVAFRNAFATTPQCCPSRASIMTGQYAHNHGVANNEQASDLDHSTTMQRYLSDAGYRTGLIGKFLNEWPLEKAPPHFDDFSLFQHGYYQTRWNINGDVQRVREYSTDFITRRAKRFVETSERRDDQPWLLYVTPWAPHASPVPHSDHRRAKVGTFEWNPAMREADCSDKPAIVDCRADMRKMKSLRQQMLRTLLSVDDLVAALDGKLENKDESDRTIVFFLSDNGYFWGEHGLEGKKPPYKGAIEIPMGMRWPGHVTPGSLDDRLVANIDIAPTVYAATGVSPGVTVDGRSLLSSDWDRTRLLLEFERMKGWPDWASTITAEYQYTEYFDDPDSPAPSFREYYDLENDPWQLMNLLGDSDPANDPLPTEQAELKRTLDQDRQCSGADCP